MLDLLERLEADGVGALELPRFAEVQLHVDGTLLVRLGAPVEAASTNVREYLVLTPDGVPMRRISTNLDDYVTILAVAGRRALLSWRGLFGAECVGLFELGG